jgi:hypothetical protein
MGISVLSPHTNIFDLPLKSLLSGWKKMDSSLIKRGGALGAGKF